MWYLNTGQKYCRMLHRSILQYFWPAFSDYWSWKPIFWFSFEWPLKTCFTVVADLGVLFEHALWPWPTFHAQTLTSSHLLASMTLALAHCIPWNLLRRGISGALIRLLLIRLSKSWRLLFHRLSSNSTQLRMWPRVPLCTASSRINARAVCWSTIVKKMWKKLSLQVVHFLGIISTTHPQQTARITQLVSCLTGDPGVMSLIPARSHTFAEIYHKIISTAILLPSADSRRVVVSYKRKYVHEVLVNTLVKLAQEKSVASWTDSPGMTIAVDWDIKNQTKQQTAFSEH